MFKRKQEERFWFSDNFPHFICLGFSKAAVWSYNGRTQASGWWCGWSSRAFRTTCLGLPVIVAGANLLVSIGPRRHVEALSAAFLAEQHARFLVRSHKAPASASQCTICIATGRNRWNVSTWTDSISCSARQNEIPGSCLPKLRTKRRKKWMDALVPSR